MCWWCLPRSEEELQRLLSEIMKKIHERCAMYAKIEGQPKHLDYVKGANIAGFDKVTKAVAAQGVVWSIIQGGGQHRAISSPI